MLVSCANWRTSAATTTNLLTKAGLAAEEFLHDYCGHGGQKQVDACIKTSDKACDEFERCEAATKALFVFHGKLLFAKIAISKADPDDDRSIPRKAVEASQQALFVLQKTLAHWGVAL